VVPATRVVAPVLALVPAPAVVADASVVAPWVTVTLNWSLAAKREVIDLLRLSVGAGGVFVYVQVMTSPTAGVIVCEVPAPDGRVVPEPLAEFVQLMVLEYDPMTDDDPAAIASVSVYVVPAVTVCAPVVALEPEPLVVAEASVVGPWVIATVNWSAALMRPATDLTSVSRGRLPLVKVHVITSPAIGVTVNEVPDPLGSVVGDPALELEQLMLDAYWPMVLTLPAAIVSVRVYVVPELTVWLPVLALTDAPAVVADATVDAPFLVATVNWSAGSSRFVTLFNRLIFGAGATSTLLVAGLLSEVVVVVSICDAPMWPTAELLTVAGTAVETDIWYVRLREVPAGTEKAPSQTRLPPLDIGSEIAAPLNFELPGT
jgi:hypothetical protein